MRSHCQEVEEDHLCWLLGGEVLHLGLSGARLEQAQGLLHEKEDQKRGAGQVQDQGEDVHRLGEGG